jgi:hypothetical protein
VRWFLLVALIGPWSCSGLRPEQRETASYSLSEDALVAAVRDWYLAKGGSQRILVLRQHEVEEQHRARFREAGLLLQPIDTTPILKRRRQGLPFLRAGLRECKGNNGSIALWEGWWLKVYIPAELAAASASEFVVELGYNEFEAKLKPWEEVEIECFGTVLVRGGRDGLGRIPPPRKGGLLLFQSTPPPQGLQIAFQRKL